eukprot:6696703-Alexandrium_andersonii.AAC.1
MEHKPCSLAHRACPGTSCSTGPERRHLATVADRAARWPGVPGPRCPARPRLRAPRARHPPRVPGARVQRLHTGLPGTA